MKVAASVLLVVIIAPACDDNCDHAPYCAKDGVHYYACSERGDTEYYFRCNGENAACIQIGDDMICALSPAPDPKCDDDRGYCDDQIHVLCEQGYRTYEEDCLSRSAVCDPEAKSCVASGATN